ncbi:MAG: hypothetical protein WD766_05630 [Gemmatimonadota bacterium]
MRELDSLGRSKISREQTGEKYSDNPATDYFGGRDAANFIPRSALPIYQESEAAEHLPILDRNARGHHAAAHHFVIHCRFLSERKRRTEWTSRRDRRTLPVGRRRGRQGVEAA